MVEVYWGCLILGILFALITTVFGDIIGSMLDGVFDFLSADGPDFLNPTVIVSWITTFGGTGVLLSEYTSLGSIPVAVLSAFVAVLLSVIVYFFYVKPMQNTENSIGFSIRDFTGKLGEVTVPIPINGYGEVVIPIGGGLSNQIAASFDREEIETGAKVVVVDVKDDTLYVSIIEHI